MFSPKRHRVIQYYCVKHFLEYSDHFVTIGATYLLVLRGPVSTKVTPSHSMHNWCSLRCGSLKSGQWASFISFSFCVWISFGHLIFIFGVSIFFFLFGHCILEVVLSLDSCFLFCNDEFLCGGKFIKTPIPFLVSNIHYPLLVMQ